MDSKPLLGEDKDPYYEGGPFDRSDKKSLINLMPSEALKHLNKIPLEQFYLGEAELRKILRPPVRLNQIRMAFWKEYDASHADMSRMTIKGILQFLDGLPSFHVYDALQDPNKLAWILCPPSSYDNMLEEALSRGLSRINEILELPLKGKDGEVDHKTTELILKAIAFLDVRKHGMPTQKIQQDTSIRQMSVTVQRRDLKALGSHTKAEDIDLRIKQLEAELGKHEVFDAE